MGITLAQRQVASTTNEAKAVLPLLSGLSLWLSIGPGDPLGCQAKACPKATWRVGKSAGGGNWAGSSPPGTMRW